MPAARNPDSYRDRNQVAPLFAIFANGPAARLHTRCLKALSANRGYNGYAPNGYLLPMQATLAAQPAISAGPLQTTDIVYHFGRDKVSIARRMKVSHLGRVKMSHP